MSLFALPKMNQKTKLSLANPRGFCAGVDRAIEIVNRALDMFGSPIYVKHEVVHNEAVVNDLKKRGAIFIEEISDVPDDSIIIFSAHGVSSKIEESVKARNLQFFDATCPLVTKVHMEVRKHAKANKDIILVGHDGHPEVEGTMGRHINSDNSSIYLVQNEEEAKKVMVNNSKHLALVTQTTLSVDETKSIINILRERYPNIDVPKKDDICYATQNRQDAVKQLALESDFIIVVAFRMIPESIWKIPKFGTINLHASLLPNYRGSAPINWVLINNENQTGITSFFIDENIDTGDILFQQKIKIDERINAGDLHDKLQYLAAEVTEKTIDGILKNKLKPVKQVTISNLKTAYKFDKKNIQIDWDNDALSSNLYILQTD